jgi:hypothetical protein
MWWFLLSIGHQFNFHVQRKFSAVLNRDTSKDVKITTFGIAIGQIIILDLYAEFFGKLGSIL